MAPVESAAVRAAVVASLWNPFSLPVHPAVNHFPLAMLTAAWVCLLLRYATADSTWDGRARLFEGVGVATLPVTIAAAFVDTRGFHFIAEHRWDAPLIWHAITASAGALAFTAHCFWRRRQPAAIAGLRVVGDLAGATVALWFLVAAGLIAGEMVYAT